MMKIPNLLEFLLFVVGVIDFYNAAGELVDSQGKEFVLGFMMNGPEYESAPLELQFSTWLHENVTVNVSVPTHQRLMDNLTVVVPPGDVISVKLPAELRMEEGTLVSPKGVLVTSDYEISVFGFNKGEYSHDSFLALPTDALGLTYLAVTMMDEMGRCPCQVGVASGGSATTLTVVLPPGPDLRVIYDGKVYNETQSFTVPMQPYEMFQMQNWNDLTGLLVEADQPVAMYSGSTCAALAGKTQDLTLEQIPPIEYWGLHFIIVPSPTAPAGDLIKVIAREPETIIGVEVPNLSEVRTILLQKGGQASVFEVSSREEVMVLQANKPVLVVYYTRSYVPHNTKGDVSMTIIPAVEQYVPYAQYRGVKTASPRRRLSHLAVLVCQSAHRQDIAVSSSSPLHTPATEWQEVGETGFAIAIITMHRNETYTFQSAQPGEGAANFGLWFIGYMPYESYGHPGGFAFKTPEVHADPESSKSPMAFVRALNIDGANFFQDVASFGPTQDPSEATISPKVEKIITVTVAISVVAIVVIFKVVGCFYTLRESRV